MLPKTLHPLLGITLAGVTLAGGTPEIEPFSVLGPNGEGLVQDTLVLSVYSETGTGNPMESPPFQVRVGDDLLTIYASSHSSLWTISESLESYHPAWKVLSPNLASGLAERKSGHEVGWSTGGRIWYPPVLRKIPFKRYPGMVGVWNLELFKEGDAGGSEGKGWGWLGEAGKATARADYEIVTNLTIREFDREADYPVLLPVDDDRIDEGPENPEPWKRIYDGIQDLYLLDSTRILTVNHTEHANAMATRPHYTLFDNVYLEPPRFFELEGLNLKIPKAGYYDIAVSETEVYHNLFRPDYRIEYDPLSRTYDPMTYGYANPVFFFYKKAGIEGDYEGYAWHQGLDWSNYFSFITINLINLDDDGRHVDTHDFGPVVWPTDPYLNANGMRRTRGVRSPSWVIRSEGGKEYLYLFYSELIGQEYEEAVEMGQPNPQETRPAIKLARAELNRSPGMRPFGTFKGYVGEYNDGTPAFLSRMDPLVDGTSLRTFLETEPWNLEKFRHFMKQAAARNRSLDDFTGHQPASTWEWELDSMTYRWEALWAEKSDYGGVRVARIKGSDSYVSVQQVSYGGRPDGNITYDLPRKYWRWVGSNQRPYELIENGPHRLYLRVSDDLVHWSDPVILNPGLIGDIRTETGNQTFTFYQSLETGFECFANVPDYRVEALPDFLEGKGCIQVPFVDRTFSGSDYLRFSAAGPLILYLAFDARYPEPPWLESWELLDETVRIAAGNETYGMRLYEKAFDGERVVLGGNGHDGLMYAVFSDMGTPSINYPRFLSADGASNHEVDIRDFYLIGSKPLLRESEDAPVLEAEENLGRIATARLRMSLRIEDFQ